MKNSNYFVLGVSFTFLSLQASAQQAEPIHIEQVEFVCTKLEKETGFEYKVIATYPRDSLSYEIQDKTYPTRFNKFINYKLFYITRSPNSQKGIIKFTDELLNKCRQDQYDYLQVNVKGLENKQDNYEFLLLNAALGIQGIATSEKEYGINIVKNKPTFYFSSHKFLKYTQYFNLPMITQIKKDNLTQVDFLYFKTPHDSVFQYVIPTGKPFLLNYNFNEDEYKFYNTGYLNFEKDEYGNDRVYRQFYHYVEDSSN
ncbi:MAG: hypothetical protein K2X69_16120 [Silvanigrellaceae bacterium]|nr:hypothetical protein [Silvanigrellaceae bacterium]